MDCFFILTLSGKEDGGQGFGGKLGVRGSRRVSELKASGYTGCKGF